MLSWLNHFISKPKPKPPKPTVSLPTHEECKEKHPLESSQWSGLHPAFPSGRHEVCTVITGTYAGTSVRCDAGRFVPSLRCNCKDHIYYQYHHFDGKISYGKCTFCDEIVAGHEDDADTWACNW
jgi:hypothetical protein